MRVGNATASITIAAAAALVAFVALVLGLPVTGPSPGPVALYVFAAVAALVAAAFVITGENLIEHLVKSVLLLLPAGVLWFAEPNERHIFWSALVACSCGTGFSAAERHLYKR
jgi:putative effector of murein hydrolase LrgA (UPF0299 family)